MPVTIGAITIVWIVRVLSLLSHRETIEAIQTVPWCIMLSNMAGKTVEVKTEKVSIQQVFEGLQK